MQRRVALAGLIMGTILVAPGGLIPAVGQIRVVPVERLDSIANPAQAKGSEAMVFESKKIETGVISQDETPSYDFRWTNKGSEPMVITRVRTSCSCLTTDYDKRPVPASGNGTITVKYNPKGYPGSFNRRIFIYTQLSETEPTAVLELSGRASTSGYGEDIYPEAMGVLRLKTKTLRFAGDRRQIERIECMNTGDTELKITATQGLLPEGITLACEPEIIPPGAIADLVVTFDPDKNKRNMPASVPLIIEGLGVPPSQRTLNLRFE